MDLQFGHTTKGFAKIAFKDDFGLECSLQESVDHPRGGCISLGVNDPDVKIGPALVSAKEALQEVADKITEEAGLAPPGDVRIEGRMHLTRQLAADLIPVLQYFVHSGLLPKDPNGKEN